MVLKQSYLGIKVAKAKQRKKIWELVCNVCIVGFYLFTFCQSDSGNTQSQPKKFKFQVILNPIIFTHDILDNT